MRTREVIIAGVVIVQNTQYVEQRLFSGTRRTHNRHQLAFANFGINAFEYVQPVMPQGVIFVNILQLNHIRLG